MKKKCIVFTGGGTAGHVTPNIALMEGLLTQDYKIEYIGSKQGIEYELIQSLDIPFHAIRSGKLRRYFSWKNLSDPLNVLFGILQSLILLLKLKPALVFSKGGFVAFPVVFAAWLLHIPVIAHESDMTPGLANRLSFPFASIICLGFSATQQYIKNQQKIHITGTPIRTALFQGNRVNGLHYCRFTSEKPCLLIIGGSTGAEIINQTLRSALTTLLKSFQIVHLCGKNKLDPALQNIHGYQQFEYVQTELPNLFAAADIVISRAGANSLVELLALQKTHILIPLSLKASRGDQIQNARYFEKQGCSLVLAEEDLSPETLYQVIKAAQNNQTTLQQHIQSLNMTSATEKIVALIIQYAKRSV